MELFEKCITTTGRVLIPLHVENVHFCHQIHRQLVTRLLQVESLQTTGQENRRTTQNGYSTWRSRCSKFRVCNKIKIFVITSKRNTCHLDKFSPVFIFVTISFSDRPPKVVFRSSVSEFSWNYPITSPFYY